MNLGSGWWSHMTQQVQVQLHTYIHRWIQSGLTTHMGALSPCHFVELSYLHEIGQKGSLLTMCSWKTEQRGDNGKGKTREMVRKDIKMISLSSRAVALKAKGWEKNYVVYISKKTHKYLLPQCAWVSNDYFQNKWQTRDFVAFVDGATVLCCKT